jgi:hypothetical protein
LELVSDWFTREEVEDELTEAEIRQVDFDEGEGYAVGAID